MRVIVRTAPAAHLTGTLSLSDDSTARCNALAIRAQELSAGRRGRSISAVRVEANLDVTIHSLKAPCSPLANANVRHW
jgi:hypothetical protein